MRRARRLEVEVRGLRPGKLSGLPSVVGAGHTEHGVGEIGCAFAGSVPANAGLQQLRRKVETDPERPHHLATETGIGYRLRGAGLGTPLFEGRIVGTAGALTSGACLDLPAVEEL